MPKYKPCGECGSPIDYRNRGGLCCECMKLSPFERAVERTDYTEEIPTIDGDLVWASDVHVPLHDVELCERVGRVGAIHGIETLVVLGDLHDFEHISSYGQLAERTPTLARSIRQTLLVLEGWARVFKRIVVVKGNHDDRLQRLIEKAATGKSAAQRRLESLLRDVSEEPYHKRYVETLAAFTAEHAPQLVERVEWLPLPLCWAKGPEGQKPILMAHQANYSRNGAHEARKLWERHTCSVITSHTHHAGVLTAPDGQHILCNAGCLTHERYHRYLHERVRGGPAWDRGFGMIKGGRISLFLDNDFWGPSWDEVDDEFDALAS